MSEAASALRYDHLESTGASNTLSDISDRQDHVTCIGDKSYVNFADGKVSAVSLYCAFVIVYLSNR